MRSTSGSTERQKRQLEKLRSSLYESNASRPQIAKFAALNRIVQRIRVGDIPHISIDLLSYLSPKPLPATHLAHEALLHLAAAAAHRLEHLAHLGVLFEDVVDLAHLHACALRDAFAAAAVDDGGVGALLFGHGVDDDGHAGELLLVHVGRGGHHALYCSDTTPSHRVALGT